MLTSYLHICKFWVPPLTQTFDKMPKLISWSLCRLNSKMC